MSRPPAPEPEGMPVEPWDLGPLWDRHLRGPSLPAGPVHADVAVVGVPYDSPPTLPLGRPLWSARHPGRLRRRYGPYNSAPRRRALRAARGGGRRRCRVAPAYHEETQRRIPPWSGGSCRRAVGRARRRPLSVSLPPAPPQHGHRGAVALVHLDAHPDTWTDDFGMRYGHGTPFYQPYSRVWWTLCSTIQTACRPDRGSWRTSSVRATSAPRESPARTSGTPACRHAGQGPRGGSRAHLPLYRRRRGRPGYARARHAEVGGLTGRHSSRSCVARRADLVGMDMVEVAPPFDHAEITTCWPPTLCTRRCHAGAAKHGVR